MKYLFALLSLVAALVATPAFAQTDNVQVDVTKLSAEELRVYQSLKQKQASSGISLDKLTPENVDKYAQMGKALGTAVNEGLSAVTKNVEQFSQTSAGKWLMVIISWKVMGNDAVGLVEKGVQYIVGIPLLAVGTLLFAWIMRKNCFARPALVSATKVGFLTVKKEFKGTTGPEWDGEHAFVAVVCYAIFIGICCLILFVG